MLMDSRWQAIHDMMKRNSGFLGLRHFNLLNKLGCGLVGTNLRYAIKEETYCCLYVPSSVSTHEKVTCATATIFPIGDG
ncbi:hypothetical protein Tco_0346917, partial [Tanacetum coccineum]